MQFTEILFAIFMLTVFVLYWLLLRSRVKAQNLLLLAASYFFYGWWDWRFLGLIILTTATTYITGLYAARRYGRLLTTLNIVFNIGILIVFKYLNFFSDNLQRLLSVFGWNLDWFTVDVLLPVGISFYTFQAIAYSVDVYKSRTAVCTDPVTFATFIAYFPQLVAGPIERASQLLPQIAQARQWNSAMASSGLRLILFGLMKKLCVADMLALYSDRIYAHIPGNPALVLPAGIVFSIEIYCDFSAYSEIARGVSRLLGIELMANFRFPYFSRNILEFWQRWHISLMLWFRDYLYIPLGGNRRGNARAMWNTVLVFVVSGIWHGAAWNFIIWGIY
ncbi:MAG: MBOAT family protein, partial [Muribaculaceae bacterium]|nr:MBOAT family protein [Muribaculaceae bacterium]